jgi:hypothetical protein
LEYTCTVVAGRMLSSTSQELAGTSSTSNLPDQRPFDEIAPQSLTQVAHESTLIALLCQDKIISHYSYFQVVMIPRPPSRPTPLCCVATTTRRSRVQVGSCCISESSHPSTPPNPVQPLPQTRPRPEELQSPSKYARFGCAYDLHLRDGCRLFFHDRPILSKNSRRIIGERYNEIGTFGTCPCPSCTSCVFAALGTSTTAKQLLSPTCLCVSQPLCRIMGELNPMKQVIFSKDAARNFVQNAGDRCQDSLAPQVALLY